MATTSPQMASLAEILLLNVASLVAAIAIFKISVIALGRGIQAYPIATLLFTEAIWGEVVAIYRAAATCSFTDDIRFRTVRARSA